MLWSTWYLIIVLRYGGSDIKVLLVGWFWIQRMLVLKFVILVACMYGERYVMKSEHDLFIDCLPYEWRSGTSDGLFLQIYPPRIMCIVLGFWWLVDFCNKYVSSLWLMLSPWIIRTLTLPSLLASSEPCIALSHLESWCKLRRCIQTPWYDTLCHT